jgi:predicted HTH domain antitoxin
MSVVISDEILQASQLSASELRQEIAIFLFETERLTLGYASQVAEMPINTFRKLLRKRHIPLYCFDVEDLQLDLENLSALGRI